MGGDAAIICRTPCFVRKNHEFQHRVRGGSLRLHDPELFVMHYLIMPFA